MINLLRTFSSNRLPQLNKLFELKTSVAICVKLLHDVTRVATQVKVFQQVLQLFARNRIIFVGVEFGENIFQLIFPETKTKKMSDVLE